jgi:hypothetical protein
MAGECGGDADAGSQDAPRTLRACSDGLVFVIGTFVARVASLSPMPADRCRQTNSNQSQLGQ